MKDKITCFKLNWYDCGLCCAENAVQEEITVYRNDNLLVFRALNGYGVVCGYEIIHIEIDEVNKFFEFLEETCSTWESNYAVAGCDGSSWEVRMWHSSHKVKKICGTVDYPQNGKKIEKYLRSFIADGKSLITPNMFACSNE